MAILLNNDGRRHPDWKRALRVHLPEREVIEYPIIPDVKAIDYAIVWNHPKGDLRRYPNLKAVLSTGSGTEHFDRDTNLPNVPIVRLIDMAMADDMALYTLYWILHFQRQFETYRQQQSLQKWKRHPSPITSDYNICLLGLGAIGAIIAQKIANNGFKISGWSRSQKNLNGVTCLSGEEALPEALGMADIIVNCLPINTSTTGFLDYVKLSQMKAGAAIINISRGQIIEDDALLSFLDSGHISAAALDVFDQEPLPPGSPFWSHPKVHVTPHMSGATNPDTAAKIISQSILTLERGEAPNYLYQKQLSKR